MARETDRARFLFDDDVNQYLESVKKGLAQLRSCRTVFDQGNSHHDYHRAVDREAELLGGVTAYFEKFPKLLPRYMRMHHPKPMWWLLR